MEAALTYLEQYYAARDEDGRLQSRYGYVEYFTTMHYIAQYLFPGARILEIGAGTGRYSHALARQGYAVDAVELVEHNIEVFRANTRPGEPVTVRRGDARRLDFLETGTYDLVLLLGPMYHLFTKEDQRAALSEAVRTAKPGGVIFAAYCMTDPSLLMYGFIKGHMKELLEKGMVETENFKAFSNPWDVFQLYRVEDIRALREEQPVTPLRIFAADGYANHMRETLDAMDEETYQIYLKYHLATCERPELLGISNHVADVFRKEPG